MSTVKKSAIDVNPDFNYGEFAIIRSRAGRNSSKISVNE